MIIDQAEILRQHLDAAAERLLRMRTRRYNLEQVKRALRRTIAEAGFFSVCQVREQYEPLVIGFLDTHVRFERVSDEPAWAARTLTR